MLWAAEYWRMNSRWFPANTADARSTCGHIPLGPAHLHICISLMERAAGFEPTQCQDGSLVPFRLATPAQKWSREWELNPRSRDYRSRALPTELSLDTEFKLVPGAGVEPA
jgi:hypothetical protein